VNARTIVGGAAVAMALVEGVAAFVEAPLAAILAVLFVLGSIWLWRRRDSVWPVAALGVLFALELLYLADYNWNETMDKLMIIATVVVSGAGLIAAVVWFIQQRRTRSAA
jgi:hypothetical protein